MDKGIKFIILGLPKTGKTMLVHTLNKIDNFRVLGEVFVTRDRSPKMPIHPQKVIEDMRLRDEKNNLYNWYKKKYNINKYDLTDDILSGNTYEIISEFLDIIFLKDKHCAFKLHQHHIETISAMGLYLKNHSEIKILHCLRKNKIKQIIATIGNRDRGSRFICDTNLTKNYLKDFEDRTQYLKKMLNENNNEYKEIYYEDLTNDTDTSTINLLDIRSLLKVDMPSNINVSTRKNTKDKVSENLINYRKFLDVFKNTQYEEMID